MRIEWTGKNKEITIDYIGWPDFQTRFIINLCHTRVIYNCFQVQSLATTDNIAPIGFALFWSLGKILDRAMPTAPYIMRTVTQGVIMALIMESLMASVTAYQIAGFESYFGTVWLRALLAGLLVVAIMSVLGAFVIKPRIEAFLAS